MTVIFTLIHYIYLFNDELNTFYIRLYGGYIYYINSLYIIYLFNDELNTFYIPLYGVLFTLMQYIYLFNDELNTFYIRYMEFYLH